MSTNMNLFNNSASFTRPNNTTAYSSGNLVANSATAGSVVPLAIPVGGQTGFGTMRFTRARLVKSGTTATLSAFSAFFYSQSPTVANGDGGAFSSNQAATFLGSITFPTLMTAFTDGCATNGSFAAGAEAFLKFTNATGQSQQFIYALLQANAAYVPAANEVFTLTLEEVAGW